MSTHLIIILTFGAVVGGWLVLTLFGAERSRRLGELEARRRAAANVIPLLRVETPSGTANTLRKPAPQKKAKAPSPKPPGTSK